MAFYNYPDCTGCCQKICCGKTCTVLRALITNPVNCDFQANKCILLAQNEIAEGNPCYVGKGDPLTYDSHPIRLDLCCDDATPGCGGLGLTVTAGAGPVTATLVSCTCNPFSLTFHVAYPAGLASACTNDISLAAGFDIVITCDEPGTGTIPSHCCFGACGGDLAPLTLRGRISGKGGCYTDLPDSVTFHCVDGGEGHYYLSDFLTYCVSSGGASYQWKLDCDPLNGDIPCLYYYDPPSSAILEVVPSGFECVPFFAVYNLNDLLGNSATLIVDLACDGGEAGTGTGGGANCCAGACGDAGVSDPLTATVTDKTGCYTALPDILDYVCVNAGGGFHSWSQTTAAAACSGFFRSDINCISGVPYLQYFDPATLSFFQVAPQPGYVCSPFAAVYLVNDGAGNTCTITVTG